MNTTNKFWTTFNNNKTTIIKCFRHIYRRCPDKEGLYNAFNNMIVHLHRLHVFEKFDPNKINGDVNKRFEQYLYTWINKILHDNYHKNKNYANKFYPAIVDDNVPKINIDNSTPKQISNPEERRGKIYPPKKIEFNNYIIDSIYYKEIKNIILNKLKKPIEQKVFMLLEDGYNKKEIAEKLNISQPYVCIIVNHIKETYLKAAKL